MQDSRKSAEESSRTNTQLQQKEERAEKAQRDSEASVKSLRAELRAAQQKETDAYTNGYQKAVENCNVQQYKETHRRTIEDDILSDSDPQSTRTCNDIVVKESERLIRRSDQRSKPRSSTWWSSGFWQTFFFLGPPNRTALGTIYRKTRNPHSGRKRHGSGNKFQLQFFIFYTRGR